MLQVSLSLIIMRSSIPIYTRVHFILINFVEGVNPPVSKGHCGCSSFQEYMFTIKGNMFYVFQSFSLIWNETAWGLFTNYVTQRARREHLNHFWFFSLLLHLLHARVAKLQAFLVTLLPGSVGLSLHLLESPEPNSGCRSDGL